MHYYSNMSDLFLPIPQARKTASILFVIMMALLLAHVIAMQIIFNEALEMKAKFGIEYWHLSIFDLDEEESFGTWFSTLMLLSASILLFYQARLLQSREDSWYRAWWVLGCLFCLLSVDEVVALHELMNSLFENQPWTIGGFIVLLVIGLAYLPFLWHYRGRSAKLFVIAGAIYGGGAVAVEHFSGTDLNSLHYNMLTGLEEGMEMFGVVIFIFALLDFLHTDSATGSRGQQ